MPFIQSTTGQPGVESIRAKSRKGKSLRVEGATQVHSDRTYDMEESVIAFYLDAIRTLQSAAIPFVVGGAYASMIYTGIERHTKDFDVFVRAEDAERVLHALEARGYRPEITFPHWLGKVYSGDAFVDVIWSSGNGIARVDDTWFERAHDADLFGCPCKVSPPEEIIWSKSFVQERERFDGADVMHLLRSQANTLDWSHLVERFAEHWRILYGHLVVFGFVYPGERNHVPSWVMRELAQRLEAELDTPTDNTKICNGPLISREQYLLDVQQWGYVDGRVADGTMTADDVANWTAAIGSIK